MTQTLFLGVATVLVAIGSFLASIQHRYTAYGFFVAGVIMVGFAVWAAYIEGIPKPHLVPIGYGKPPDHKGPAGLVFFNDGEPAYNIEPPKETRISKGSATLLFEDPHLSRLSKDGGMQCFPIRVKYSDGQTISGDLRTELILWHGENVLISFRYADSKRPRKLRYTTVCSIKPIGTGVAIELEKNIFEWWKL